VASKIFVRHESRVNGDGPNLFSTSLLILCRKDRVAESPRYTGKHSANSNNVSL
jgi:hypothetical protein